MSEDIESICPKGFFTLFGWIYSKGLDVADIATYGLLGNLGAYNAETNTVRCCQPSRRYMATLLGCSVQTVDRSLARLVATGLIEGHEMRADDGASSHTEYTIRCGGFNDPC